MGSCRSRSFRQTVTKTSLVIWIHNFVGANPLCAPGWFASSSVLLQQEVETANSGVQPTVLRILNMQGMTGPYAKAYDILLNIE